MSWESWRANSTAAGSEKETKANPLGLPLRRSLAMTHPTTAPYLEKCSVRVSSEVSHEIPPTKSLLWSEKSSIPRQGNQFYKQEPVRMAKNHPKNKEKEKRKTLPYLSPRASSDQTLVGRIQ